MRRIIPPGLGWSRGAGRTAPAGHVAVRSGDDDRGVLSGNLFQTLGTPATLGRLLTTHDGAEAVAMSETLWRRHYNADPNVIGRTIVIAGHPYTIVGVSPSGFTGLRLIDEGTDETSQPRRAHLLTS